MLLSDYTKTQQQNLALYCKTGKPQQIDGLTDGRLNNYRRLIYNIVDDSLRSAFPLTENLLEKSVWNELVNLFIAEHNFTTPQIWKMPFEFYEFVMMTDLQVKNKYVHLVDLLLFEWKEIEIYMMMDKNDFEFSKNGSYRTNEIALNLDAEIITLSYPVHLNNAKEITEKDYGNYFVLLFRANDKVQFVDLSPLLAWFLEQLFEKRNIQSIVKETSSLTGINDEKLIINHFIKFLDSMKIKGFVLGFKNKRNKI